MLKKKIDNVCALILGGHVNGYSIIKELFEQGIRDIALFDSGFSLARCSNKVNYRAVINNKPNSLLLELKKLNNQYDYIVIFPTDDLQLENLNLIYDDIHLFCYLPFNRKNLKKISDKFFQYQTCEKIGVKFPKTFNIKSAKDLNKVKYIKFPILIKPSKKNPNIKIFRSLFIENIIKFISSKKLLKDFLNKDIEFVLSEYIPGKDNNIYAYTCFRSQDNKILNEWVGRKLSQHPDEFGNFSSAANTFNLEVLQNSRKLVKALDAFGIIEPEFKYDYRDKSFKLIEVNLRSMMWHRTGSISNVKLHETQYNYAIGKKINKYKQDKNYDYHFVLMLHEISNLIFRKNYWKVFKYNIFRGDKVFWAIFEWKDIKPFCYSLILLIRLVIVRCLKLFFLR